MRVLWQQATVRAIATRPAGDAERIEQGLGSIVFPLFAQRSDDCSRPFRTLRDGLTSSERKADGSSRAAGSCRLTSGLHGRHRSGDQRARMCIPRILWPLIHRIRGLCERKEDFISRPRVAMSSLQRGSYRRVLNNRSHCCSTVGGANLNIRAKAARRSLICMLMMRLGAMKDHSAMHRSKRCQGGSERDRNSFSQPSNRNIIPCFTSPTRRRLKCRSRGVAGSRRPTRVEQCSRRAQKSRATPS